MKLTPNAIDQLDERLDAVESWIARRQAEAGAAVPAPPERTPPRYATVERDDGTFEVWRCLDKSSTFVAATTRRHLANMLAKTLSDRETEQ